jgi:hypothetical protein
MTIRDLPRIRLHNQQITRHTFRRPDQVVAWLGAVQAQDYLGGLWAVGLRLRGTTERDIERALDERTIIRTWPMRGTLHFVAADDARWMTELMAPRILAGNAGRLKREHGIDDNVAGHARALLRRALEGGRQLSRDAIYAALEGAGIAASGGRGLHLLWRLAQEGLLCFGGREGKQQTFALLDEWLPGARRMEREEALAELARRYFTGHGPATIQDCMWWSGLTAADVRAGLAMVAPELDSTEIDGTTYWFSPSMEIPPRRTGAIAHILPNYDEYIVGYKDRSSIYTPPDDGANSSGIVFSNTVVLDGEVVGTWKRALGTRDVRVATTLPARLNGAERRAVSKAIARYGEFLELPAIEVGEEMAAR